MKALTLTQPWATLVAIGAKRIETRSWPTRSLAPLAIHAAKGFPGACRELCEERAFLDALRAGKYGAPLGEDLPLGAIVATARVAMCLKIGRTPDGRVFLGRHVGLLEDITEPELSFGDFTPGRWAWVLADVVKLPKPIPARGAQGLWNWEPSQ